MDIKRFDIESYLKIKGITYSTSGKNVSEGWIGIKCLWCSDKSDHLGINLHSKAFRCWKCKIHGSVAQIVQKIERCEKAEVENIIDTYSSSMPASLTLSQKWECKINANNILPKEATLHPSPMHTDYLEQRGFDISQLVQKYNILFTHHLGPLKFRIIIPIIINHTTVGFTARDVTGKAELRYISSKKEHYTVNPSSVLYNLDSVTSDKLVLVEGVTDVWKLGDGAVGMMGTEFTELKLRRIAEKKLRRCFILFDAEREAQKLASRVAMALSVVIPEVEIVTLDPAIAKDPGELTLEQGMELMRSLN